MLFLSSAQHMLFFYHLVAIVASASFPRGPIERSAYSTASKSSKYTNSSSPLSDSTTASSFHTSISSTISTSSRLSSGISLASTNLTKFGIHGSSLGTGYISRATPDENSFSSSSIGTKSSKEISSATGIPPHGVYFNCSLLSSTETTPKHETISSAGKNVTKSEARKSISKATSAQTSGIISTGKIGTTKKAKLTSQKFNITSKPSYSMFGSQTITRASCKSTTLGKSADHYCRIMIGTVQLHYWPTGTAAMNRSYPSTIYLEDYDITMTSPSVYFAINTMKATDLCGKQVGPTIKNYAVGFDVTDVYTLQPFANTKVTTRMGDPKQLQLSDLRTDCPQTTILPEDIFDYLETNHVVLGQDSQCNPILSWPTDLRLAAGNFWTSCGRHWGGKLGIFDPPIPVTACTGDALACLYGSTKISSAPASTTKFTEPASALDDLITTTPALPVPTISSEPSSTGNEEFASLLALVKSSLASSPGTAGPPKSMSRTGPADFFFSAQSTPTATVAASSEPETSFGPTDPPGPRPVVASTDSDTRPQVTSPLSSSATIIAIVGSNTFSAVPGSSGIILPNGSTASVGAVITISNESSSPVTVSVGSSNFFSGSETYFIPALTPVSSFQAQAGAPVAIATLFGDSIISTTPGVAFIIIDLQTASLDGPAVTEGANVVKLTLSGVEIENLDNSMLSTYSIPALSSAMQNFDSVNVDVVGGHSISVEAVSPQGSSAAVVGGQTINLGGPVATLTGGNIVSLGSNGVIVQAPAGKITTIPVPSAQTNLANMAIVNEQTISVVAGSIRLSVSIAVAAGQAISAGDLATTLSGGQIASLGKSGVIIQLSGGYFTTITVSISTPPVNSASFVDVGVFVGQKIAVEMIQSGSAAIVGGQTISYAGPIATVSGGNIVSFGVNGVVVQASSGKVTTIPIFKTASSASDMAITTVEFGAPTTSSSTLDASASRTGTANVVEIVDSGQRIHALTCLTPLLAGWTGVLILRLLFP